VSVAQPVLWVLWKVLPETRSTDGFKLAVFIGILAWVGNRARLGLLPRTRPIVPGELAVSDESCNDQLPRCPDEWSDT